MPRPALAASLALLLAVALAAAPAPADEVDEEIARRHFVEGSAFYQKGEYKRALAEFEAARKVKPAPAFDYNIGRCLDRLERAVDAVAAYERYLVGKPDAEDAAEI